MSEIIKIQHLSKTFGAGDNQVSALTDVSLRIRSGEIFGIIGGGGLGKLAIDYGYYNFKTLVMWVAVIGLIILVQLLQTIGTKLANVCDKRLRK